MVTSGCRLLPDVSKLPLVVLDVTTGLLVTSGLVRMLPDACLLPAVVLECYQRSAVYQHFFSIVTKEVIWLPAVVSVVATNSVFLFPTSPGKMTVGFGERGLPGQLVVSLMPY